MGGPGSWVHGGGGWTNAGVAKKPGFAEGFLNPGCSGASLKGRCVGAGLMLRWEPEPIGSLTGAWVYMGWPGGRVHRGWPGAREGQVLGLWEPA